MAFLKEKSEHTNTCVHTQHAIWWGTCLLVKPSERMSLASLIWGCFLGSLVCRFWFLFHLEKEQVGCDWGWQRRVPRMAYLGWGADGGRWQPEGVRAPWALSNLHGGQRDQCTCFVFWWGQREGWRGSERVQIQKDSPSGDVWVYVAFLKNAQAPGFLSSF